MIDTVKYGALHETTGCRRCSFDLSPGPFNPARTCGFTDVRVREKAAAETRHLSACPASVSDISFDHRDIRRRRRLISMPVTWSSYIIRATPGLARSGNDLITGISRQMGDHDTISLLWPLKKVLFFCCTRCNLRDLELYNPCFDQLSLLGGKCRFYIAR